MERILKILLTGLLSVIMALVSSYGICSVSGFFITPLHNFIPFLLLGLGVDDMFVIIQAFKQLEPPKDKNELPTKIAKVLYIRLIFLVHLFVDI